MSYTLKGIITKVEGDESSMKVSIHGNKTYNSKNIFIEDKTETKSNDYQKAILIPMAENLELPKKSILRELVLNAFTNKSKATFSIDLNGQKCTITRSTIEQQCKIKPYCFWVQALPMHWECL